MSYRDRLRPNIQLTSPDGTVFTALWRGNDRTQAKKVGIFNFPGVDGSVVQDLGVSSATYTLSISFDGPDNDITADQFFQALSEKGVWEVIHPVHGEKKLQPLTFTPADQPVTSGNVTQIETEWIEPLDLAVVPSVPELQATVKAQIETVNDISAGQLSDNTFQETAAEVSSFRATVLDVVANVESYLESISDFSATITSEMLAIKRDINAIQDTQARLDAYKNFAVGVGLLSPETPGTPSYNSVLVQEQALTAAMGAIADISSTGTLLSRTEAVGVIEDVLTLFNDVTDNLDASQVLFEGAAIDRQYFSQSQSYSVAARLVALTVAYLLRAAFDLKVEKRFVLARARNPVMVTIEEYGDLGDGDVNLDLFLDSNKIQGNEFMVMSAGRELVVYV